MGTAAPRPVVARDRRRGRAPTNHWKNRVRSQTGTLNSTTRASVRRLSRLAYEPRWFMQSVHMNPAEAVQAHLDLGATESGGIPRVGRADSAPGGANPGVDG